MAPNNGTVVTGSNATFADAATALNAAIEGIETSKTIFLADVYKVGANWHHLLVHQA
tara:strand:- start:75 stop:245 length:171 start_codon:yes stop_codon:yes gene_type:complete